MPKGIHLVQSESFPVLKLNLSEQFETSKKKRWVNITYILLCLCLFLSSTLSLCAKKTLLFGKQLLFTSLIPSETGMTSIFVTMSNKPLKVQRI